MRVSTAAAIASILALILLLAVTVVLLFPIPQRPEMVQEEPTLEIRLVGGEVGDIFGFALEGREITSPGPEIRVKVGDVVRIVFVNKGRIPHSLAIVEKAEEGARRVFRQAIGSAASPIAPGEEGSIVLKPQRPGRFAYICEVPGHVLLGMYGEFIVEERA